MSRKEDPGSGFFPDVSTSPGLNFDPEIRQRVYSLGSSYESDNGYVGDETELRRDVEKLLYDNGIEAGVDEVVDEILELEENGKVNGEDVKKVVSKYYREDTF